MRSFFYFVSSELIPFLSQHVCGAASNQLTNTDHRQSGEKSLPTLSAALSPSLKQHFTEIKFTYGSTRWSSQRIYSPLWLNYKHTDLKNFRWLDHKQQRRLRLHTHKGTFFAKQQKKKQIFGKAELKLREVSQCTARAAELRFRPHTSSKWCLPTSLYSQAHFLMNTMQQNQ